MNPFRE